MLIRSSSVKMLCWCIMGNQEINHLLLTQLRMEGYEIVPTYQDADVVVAVPQAWLDVQSMADLADVAARFRIKHYRPMRVATKYVALTRRFLALCIGYACITCGVARMSAMVAAINTPRVT